MRFRFSKKSFAVLSAFVFLSSSALAANITVSEKTSMVIANGAAYTSFKGLSENSNPETGFFIEYTPSTLVSPETIYGNHIYGNSPITWALDWAKENGKTVMAAINADFFSLQTGIPLGAVVSNGELKSSDAGYNALGFKQDGTAVIGKPALTVTMDTPYGQVLVDHINKLRQPYGLYLLTSDFSDGSKVTTPGIDILFKIENGDAIKIGQSVTLTVADTMTSDFSVAIPKGYCLLTVDNKGPISRLPAFKIGDTVTLNVTASDTRFNDVVQAVGGGDILIENGTIPEFSNNESHPRSAVGIKSDGQVVMYEIDGRQPGYSNGLTLSQLANELYALGCVNAINLDGGGSSIISVRRPGDDNMTVLNRPSDGKPRSIANYIMLVNSAPKSDIAKKLFCYPNNPVIFTNSKVNFTMTATDGNYYPLSLPSDVTVKNSPAGSVTENGIFTSGSVASQSGVELYSQTASGLWNIKVVDTLTSIKATSGGKVLSSIDIAPSGTIDIDASAYVDSTKILSSDSAFHWSLSPSAGVVDQNGVIVASAINGATGFLTLSGGGITLSIPVNVGQPPQIIADFETENPAYGFLPTNSDITVSPAPLSKVKYGKSAIEVLYNFNTANPVSISTPLTFKNQEYLNLWIYGDNSKNKLSAKLSLSSNTPGGTAEIVLAENLNFTGWKHISAVLPAGAVSMSEIIITKTDGGSASGSIALDNIIVSAGAAFSDFEPPVISDITLTEIPLRADDLVSIPEAIAKTNILFTVSDNSGRPLKPECVVVKADGNKLASAYDLNTGAVSALTDLSGNSLHIISVQCSDIYGNISKKSLVVPASATESVFFDMGLNWAKDYAEFMYKKGIILGEDYGESRKFSPNRSLTRAEFFVIMSRYLGYDEGEYSDISVPFADVSAIPGWAFGSVKALYSHGLLSGKQSSDGKLIFDPSAVITREEAMYALSNLLPRGFTEAELAFSDSDKISLWAKDGVRLLTSLSVITGYSDSTLRPQNNIMRCEISKIFSCMY